MRQTKAGRTSLGRYPLQSLQEEGHPLLVAGVLAAETGRERAGRAAQRVHFNSRVIGQGYQPAGLREGLRLYSSILGVAAADLFHIQVKTQVTRRHQLPAGVRQQFPVLGCLAGVVGG